MQTHHKDVPAYIKALPTTSAKIRVLTEKGWSRSEIADALDIRYQHVRQVQLLPLTGSNRVH
jgi:hypothetical protein